LSLGQRGARHLDGRDHRLGDLERVADGPVVDVPRLRGLVDEVLVKGLEDDAAREQFVHKGVGLRGEQRRVPVHDRPSVAQGLEVEFGAFLEGRLERNPAGASNVQVVAVERDV